MEFPPLPLTGGKSFGKMNTVEGGKGKKKTRNPKNSKLFENLKVAVNRGTQAKRLGSETREKKKQCLK